jgi:predicted enzyme related to lactoylglutathione lyase
LQGACDFYTRLLGWRAESIEVGASSYLALDFGGGPDFGGGVVGCGTEQPLWLPYVEVPDLRAVTDRARGLGAAVQLEPREGPVGWRSIVATPAAAAIALWQPKR